MPKYDKDQEYLLIIDNIINNNDFSEISSIKHHNTTRLNHCLKVSYYSYKIAKALRLDYVDVARGGLLHDFYKDEICECDKIKDKVLLFSVRHTNDAVDNASQYFDLTEKEINIISTHMFPMNYKLPKYAESWIVNFVDKVLSFSEVSKKLKYKISYVLNIFILFLIGNFK